ncbi:MAG: TonB-dependent receptor [Ignavibacteriae bacterium]|nr:TonB-dependent receptor [Ignavibacteriota bacterium]
MLRKLSVFAVLLTVALSSLMAQDGKLRGIITDKATGEGLIGANVILEGTSLGASSDINGEFVILSIPPGIYSVKASYIGYAAMTVSNVRVSANLTTTQNFELNSTAIQTTEVEVVADRPLIQRNTTNTVRMQTQEDIESLPFRGLQNIVALSAGVVQQDGTLYVRGGRAGEVSYFIDGATSTNPMFNSEAVTPIQEAIEEVQLQSGGYTAEFGGSNSAIVRTTMRTGSSQQFRATLDYQTDDFAAPGEEFLGTSSRGYRNAVITLSGPVMQNLRYFIAGQHNYARNRDHLFIEPFRFDGLTTDGFDNRPVGTPLPGLVEMKRNYQYKNSRNENTLQGTLLLDVLPFKLRFSGSYTNIDLPAGNDWRNNGLTNIFRQRDFRNVSNNYLWNLRFTHVLDTKTFYEIGVSYLRNDLKAYDPDFGDNWRLYADSTASRAKGYIQADGSTGFLTRFLGPQNYTVIYAFPLAHEYSINNAYQRNEQTNIGLTIDFTSQVNPQWEVKAGGRIDAWSMRLFAVGNISNYNTFIDQTSSLYHPDSLAANPGLAKELEITAQRQSLMNIYGYDFKGRKVDDGFNGPREPMFASAYVQNKFEFNDLVVNAGVRYELFDMKNIAPVDFVDPTWNDDLNYFASEDQLKETDPTHLLLPRVSFSFPVTDKTVFYGMFGKYAQLPVLNRLYSSTRLLADRVSPRSRVGFSLGTNPAGTGFLVKPERTTQYEVGFRQTLTDNFAFTVTGFYKDLRDQIQLNRIYNDAGVPLFVAYGNSDFGTVKGLEMTLELRRTNRFQARVNYTLSDARGTASNPASSRNAVSDGSGTSTLFPSFINSLDFDQTHRGTLLLDYRWAKGDGGPVLEGFGVNTLLTFNSGHAYTKIREPENLGQASPWNIGIRPIIDPRTRNPVEPLNSSTTPWMFNVDLSASKVFYFESFTAELYLNVLNLFDTKHVVNVFPNTGTPTDDAWLRSPLATSYVATANYADFYKAINIDNRVAYLNATGNDMYGTPREVRLGLKLEI